MELAAEEVYVLPASYAQQRMWFLDQLEPGSPAYTIALAVRLLGGLDEAALRQALQTVVTRHESLRTTFADVDGDGRPHQVVAPRATADLPVTDLTGVPAAERESRAGALAAEAAAAPFDLARGPLLRVRLARLAAEDHVLLVSMHHIISDGWSLGVLVGELGECYRAAVRGEKPDLPELPVQYPDYAVWQREWLEGERLAEEIAHWRSRLAGAPALLELPTDRPRPAVQSFRGASVRFHWPVGLLERLRTLGRDREATLYMVLLAGFNALLARYSGGDDIVVGTPVAGRTRPELEGLIGLFVNTLALRTRLDDDPDFDTLLARVREVCLDAYSHQELPFERLVEALEPERSLSHSPLVQALFVLQNTPAQDTRWPGLRVVPLEGSAQGTTAKFDLSLTLHEGPDGIEGSLEYNRDLFDRATAERLSRHYRRLLEGVAEEPDRPVSRVPLLTSDEQHTILHEWNEPAATAHPATPGRGVHELFAEQAARTPDAPALVHAGVTLTYRELDERANRLARHLRELGVATETLVGLCLERSPDLVVAMLAILKAGGAYLPLDPEYPPERLALMLSDAGTPVIVTRRRLAERLDAPHARLLCVDTQAEHIAGQAPQPPDTPVTPLQTAYVLYTSGSTGRPKGVVIAHANVTALLDWARATFPPQARQGVLATTSICFDLSVFEIFLPLTSGGTVILTENTLDLPDGAGAGATLLNTVPSVMAELLRLGGPPPTVRTVCLAGEALPASLVDEVYASTGVEHVFNLYGPTEATTYATGTLQDRAAPLPPSIGGPVTGTRVYVLDRWLAPVPVGVAGDLYIGGAGVARGYFRRPALTAGRFVADPFADTPGARLYRTGDLAKWRSDGVLDFLGRSDHQVKVRGFRIEPGEVEAVLRAHPAVREAVVLVREDTPGDRRLVAYVVPATTPAPPNLAEQLQLRCASQLPGYMVPSALEPLDTLPLTPSGKTDRRALPAPQNTHSASQTAHVPPRNPVEAVIAGIWQQVLNVEHVGVHDRFFALGGHSLLATQVAARLRAAFSTDVPLRAIFEAPTVAGLAEALVADETEPGRIAAIAELRHHIDSLSPEEILAHLNEE